MQKVFVNVVNQDLKNFMHKINVPTLLIWGENDTATPIKDARIMEKLIPNSGLVILKNCGHYCFLEKSYEFNIIINNFLNKDQTNG
jgi:pimeloyl-ACP methyl ester carboxylesterase